MSEFDTYKTNINPAPEEEPPPECDFGFSSNLNLITKYNPKYCKYIIEFAQKGNFLQGFCGHFNICSNTYHKQWLNREDPDYAEFRSAAKTAQSALISYFNKKLIHAIDNYDTHGNSISVLRSILAELLKDTPKAIRDLQYEDIEGDETSEERKERLEKEKRHSIHAAFRGSTALAD